MAVRVDENIARVCGLSNCYGSRGDASYEIPYGREEKETGSAYAPASFAGNSHRVAVRTLKKKEMQRLSQSGAESL